MSYFEIINRMRRLDYLIKFQSTGNAIELAGKLGVSRRRVFDYISMIKDYDAEVQFDKNRKTFYYKKDFDLKF